MPTESNKQNHMTTLAEAKSDAARVMKANNLTFATIWLTGKSYGFNFDKKEVGFKAIECGVTRKVVEVIN